VPRAAFSLVVPPLVAAALVRAAATAAAAPASAPAARLSDFFTPEQIARADRYRGPHYAYAFAALGVSLLVLGALAFGPVARRVGAAVQRLAGDRWAPAVLLLVAVVALAPSLAALPFSVAGFFHDRAFGLATASLGGFLSDFAKGVGFQVVISAVAGLASVGIARALPVRWPLVVAAAGVVFTFALVYLFPLVYEPAFNKFRPVDPVTRARVLRIADAEGIRVKDVLVADASRRTTRSNAYVSGIGPTKRVVLYDTLLATTPPDEVDLVVAHELAHVKHHDVLRGAVFGAAGLAAGVAVLWWLLRWGALLRVTGARGAGDPRIVPFLAFFIAAASLLTAPAQNAISRRIEARADRTALEVTKNPRAQIALEVRLSVANLSDLHPNAFIRWAFFTHPAPLERIQAALDYEAEHR
jgi:STE24 endopeptidase